MGRRLSRWLPWLALVALTLSLLGCGVAISESEVAATAESEASATPQAGVLDARSAAADPPASPLGVGATPLPSLTPEPSSTPSVTPSLTPEASATPVTTETPAPGATSAATQTASPSATATSAPAPTTTALGTDLGSEIFRLLNEARAAKGLQPFRWNPNLGASASGYARLMADANHWGATPHTGPDGSTSQSRVAASGYPGHFRGEALAAGQITAQAVLNVWLSSPSHAVILLDTLAVDIGVGHGFNPNSQFGHYWVLTTGYP